MCGHAIHEEKAANGEEDDEKYCVGDLWSAFCLFLRRCTSDSLSLSQCYVPMFRHPDCNTPSKHQFECSHPFGNSHVIFVCDCSGSMSDTDGGDSVAEYYWIKDAGANLSYGLNNRMGALYSAIHKFIDIRGTSMICAFYLISNRNVV